MANRAMSLLIAQPMYLGGGVTRFDPNDRVAMLPHTDAFMRGQRFGVFRGYDEGSQVVTLKMDRGGLLRCTMADFVKA